MNEFIKLTRIVETTHCEESEVIRGELEEIIYVRKSKIDCIIPDGDKTKIFLGNTLILVKENFETVTYLLDGYTLVPREEYACNGNCEMCSERGLCLGTRKTKTVSEWKKL